MPKLKKHELDLMAEAVDGMLEKLAESRDEKPIGRYLIPLRFEIPPTEDAINFAYFTAKASDSRE